MAQPWNAYGQDLFNTNYNGRASQLINEANNRAALLQAGMMAPGAGKLSIGGRVAAPVAAA